MFYWSANLFTNSGGNDIVLTTNTYWFTNTLDSTCCEPVLFQFVPPSVPLTNQNDYFNCPAEVHLTNWYQYTGSDDPQNDITCWTNQAGMPTISAEWEVGSLIQTGAVVDTSSGFVIFRFNNTNGFVYR
jgi:hypothetical protein